MTQFTQPPYDPTLAPHNFVYWSFCPLVQLETCELETRYESNFYLVMQGIYYEARDGYPVLRYGGCDEL